MSWGKLLGKGFAHMDAPFGLHPSDKKGAREYRDAVRDAGLSWEEVMEHVHAYGDKRGWTDEKRAEEIKRVRKYMGM